MQRGTTTPLLRARRTGDTMELGRQAGRNRLAVTIVILLGALLLGLVVYRVHGLMTEPTQFLVKEDYSSEKLSPEKLQELVGMFYAKDTTKNSELEALYKQGVKLPKNTRVIPPGGMVTMDFVEDRLNVHLDGNSCIKKAKYG
ncbi:hypothetical protein PSACC_00968 [Paramicrosporidium saccamoebae]|uniref:Uncharacterized protein n=1 Tax=Paramicrosporidium saccamoebae TaxID=1246581 RepID=A0A2H9TNI8_9FUNG|nr:hypothetical protein PSACC_00968 [Paramicrosporidium saccamoebae]